MTTVPKEEHIGRTRKGGLSADAVDLIVLASIVLLSACPYIFGIGFYTDDWGYLADFKQMAGGPFDFITAGVFHPALARPLQGIGMMLLHKLFGLSPLPYHLVNTAAFTLCCLLLLRLLRQIGFGRGLSFALALTFALLPQFSTIRIWYSAFQITFSLLFFLIACLCTVRWHREGGWRWKLGAALAGLASLGFYELFAPPLLAVAVTLTIIRLRHAVPTGRPTLADHYRAIRPQIPDIAVVLAAVIFKKLTSTRGTPLDMTFFRTIVSQFINPYYDWRIDHGLNAKGIVIVHLWHTIALPFRSIATMAGEGRLGIPAAVALIVGATAYARLRTGESVSSWAFRPGRLILTGIGVMIIGYATFLMSSAVGLSPAGMSNRTTAAAALGVAAILIGLIGWGVTRMPATTQKPAMAAIVAVLAALMALRLADVGHYWASASARQQPILAAAAIDLKAVPAGSTVILDGICPFDGPATIFETRWDSGGALTLVLDRPVMGDVVTDRLTWGPAGITTTIYGADQFYRYGPGLLIYNPVRHWVVPLTSAEAAMRYKNRPGRFTQPCPRGYVAHGVPI